MISPFQSFWNKKWSNPGADKKLEENPFTRVVLDYKRSGQLLDLGAGKGRDSVFFLTQGFEVTAFDFSQIALERIKNPNIKKNCGNIQEYDFGNKKYDVIYASNSLHYFPIKVFQEIIEKLYLSLKKGGYIVLRVKSVSDCDFGEGEELEKNYYKNGEDYKYYFSKTILEEVFFDFEVIVLEEKNDIHNTINGYTSVHSFIDMVVKKV